MKVPTGDQKSPHGDRRPPSTPSDPEGPQGTWSSAAIWNRLAPRVQLGQCRALMSLRPKLVTELAGWAGRYHPARLLSLLLVSGLRSALGFLATALAAWSLVAHDDPPYRQAVDEPILTPPVLRAPVPNEQGRRVRLRDSRLPRLLLRGLDASGPTWYTNRRSLKGRELAVSRPRRGRHPRLEYAGDSAPDLFGAMRWRSVV